MQLFRRITMVAVVLCVSSEALAQQQLGALKGMVDAERRFAKTSVETNIRESFLAFFADDGVEFNPAPVNAKESLGKLPAPPKPPPVTLDWDPTFANVSQAGDLGFTTGPYILTDNVKKATASQGYFFSVWKKQADGQWKVVLDYGVQAPGETQISHARSVKSGTQSKYRAKGKVDPEAELKGLIEAEQRFSIVSETNSTAEAYARFLDSEARMNRNGTQPYVGSAAINSHLSHKKEQIKWNPTKADVASSGDLGYTYGTYESSTPSEASSLEKGYFARVWNRDEKGIWKIVMDASSPLEK